MDRVAGTPIKRSLPRSRARSNRTVPACTIATRHTALEYVNAAGFTTSNVENFFGVFKRGMRGTYTFCGEQHLQRYLAEFQFRYNNRSGLGVSDGERAAMILKGVEGRRLTYRRLDEATHH